MSTERPGAEPSSGRGIEELWRAFEGKARIEREAAAASQGYPAERAADAALACYGSVQESGVRISISNPDTAMSVEVFARREDLEALQNSPQADGRQSALEYLSSLLVHSRDNAYRWQPHPIGNGIADANELAQLRNQSGEEDDFLPHTKQEVMRTQLADGESVYVEGKTATGKGHLVKLFKSWWLTEGRSFVRLDMIDPEDCAESLMHALLALPRDKHGYLAVVEGVQANRPGTQEVFELVHLVRRSLGVKLAVLAAGWLGSDRYRKTFDQSVHLYRTEPMPIMQYILERRGIWGENVEKIMKLAGENLVFAEYAADAFEANDGRVPGREEFFDFMAGQLGLDRINDWAAQRALYRLACFAEYEIDVPQVWAKQLMRNEIGSLLKSELVQVADTSYRVPGRSVAQVIGYHAVHRWHDPAAGRSLPAADAVISSYLRQRGNLQLGMTLTRLSDLGLADERVGEIGRFLIIGWNQRARIAHQLRRRVEEDEGHWGENSAAVAYAGLAAALLDDFSSWELMRNVLRASWDTADVTQPPRCRDDEPTQDVAQFERIKSRMEAEDAHLGADSPWSGDLSGAQYQVEKAHRVWMLGLLLIFEGRAPDKLKDSGRLRQLVDCARELHGSQLRGVFYSPRTPMASALILLGLCEAGYSDDPVATSIAAWLRQKQNGDVFGGAFHLGWKSGIGNLADPPTAALCLIALHRHGAGPENANAMKAGLSQLADLAEPVHWSYKALRLMAIFFAGNDGISPILPELRQLMERAARYTTWHPEQAPTSGFGASDEAPPESEDLTLAVALILEIYQVALGKYMPQLFLELKGIASVADLPQQPPGNGGPTEGGPQALVAAEPAQEAHQPPQEEVERFHNDMDRANREIDRKIDSLERASRKLIRQAPKEDFQKALNGFYLVNRLLRQMRERADRGEWVMDISHLSSAADLPSWLRQRIEQAATSVDLFELIAEILRWLNDED
jgi:hypothetical protein